MKTKTKFLLIILLIALIVAAVLVYYIFVKGPAEISGPQIETPKTEEATPTTKEEIGKLLQITDENVISPAINEEKNTIKYITKNDGALHQASLDGKDKVKIPFVSLGGLINIIWSPDQEKFINIYSDVSGVKRFFYDIKAKNVVPLNKNITWADYSKTEDKIVYHYYDGAQGINSIAISEADGTLSKNVVNTRLKDVRLNWVTADKVVISTAPSGLAQNILYSLNPENPKLIKILSGIYGLTSKWSHDGVIFVFSETDQRGANLTLKTADGNGLNVLDTKISTLSEKCVFSKDNINVYCAEPTIIPENTILPDDYYKKTFSANDRLWKLNTKTNKKDILHQFNEDINFDLSNLTLTKDEKYLYFVNRTNGFLYRLEL